MKRVIVFLVVILTLVFGSSEGVAGQTSARVDVLQADVNEIALDKAQETFLNDDLRFKLYTSVPPGRKLYTIVIPFDLVETPSQISYDNVQVTIQFLKENLASGGMVPDMGVKVITYLPFHVSHSISRETSTTLAAKLSGVAKKLGIDLEAKTSTTDKYETLYREVNVHVTRENSIQWVFLSTKQSRIQPGIYSVVAVVEIPDGYISKAKASGSCVVRTEKLGGWLFGFFDEINNCVQGQTQDNIKVPSDGDLRPTADEETKQAQIVATQTPIAEQTRQVQVRNATATAAALQTATIEAEQTREMEIAATQTSQAQIAEEETRQAKIAITQRWGSCTWKEVGAISSHNTGSAWCPAGSFLTQFDLDGDRAYSEYDTPFVGRARCCTLNDSALSYQWGSCNWVGVGTAGINSHAQGAPWCSDGSFLTQFDLDSNNNLLPSDSPIIGQAMCCTLNDAQLSRWESCTWQGVETIGINSHAQEPVWGPQGSFLTAFDLDGPQDIDSHDAPVVGQALFCRAGLSN